MQGSILMALKYLYLSQLKAIENNEIKGLQYKQCFNFIKMIKQLSIKIENNEIKDLEEVLSYGK